jgi:hypothetical protein
MKTPLQAEEGNSMAIENPTTNSAICICGISEVGTLGKMMDKPNVAATRQIVANVAAQQSPKKPVLKTESLCSMSPVSFAEAMYRAIAVCSPKFR